MIFFTLISTAFSSIFYGVIITVVIMAILYALLRAISKGIVQSIPFYITGVVMAILLIIQLSLMIGAIQAKSAADSAEIYTSQLLENASGVVGAQDSQRVLETIREEFPIIGAYIGVADFSGTNVSDLAESMHNTIVDYLNTYIWHRVWWTLGILVVACVVVVMFGKPATEMGTARRSNRSERQRVSSVRHQRVSHRRH